VASFLDVPPCNNAEGTLHNNGVGGERQRIFHHEIGQGV
jgi:hypothetical protein